jgi:hypothetical protein
MQILLVIVTVAALWLGAYFYRKDRRPGVVAPTVHVTPPESIADEGRLQIAELKRRIAGGNSS